MEEGFSEYLAMIRVCSDASPSPATFSDVRVSYATSAGSATSATSAGSAGTVTNGVYTSSSVTALNDVSSAGSGAIITTAERSKLGGIATSADVTGSNTAANTNKITSIGTQPDKLNQALETAMGLLTEMPIIDNQIEAARNSILKQIASDRKIKDQKYFFYLSNLKRGINYDSRKDTYEYIKTAKQEDLVDFFESKIEGNTYTLMVMGNKEDLDLESLKKYGSITEISLEELFGY